MAFYVFTCFVCEKEIRDRQRRVLEFFGDFAFYRHADCVGQEKPQKVETESDLWKGYQDFLKETGLERNDL